MVQRYEASIADHETISEKKEISRLRIIVNQYEERLRFSDEEMSRAKGEITTLNLNVQAAVNEVKCLNTEKNNQNQLLRSSYEENSRLNDAISYMQATLNELEKVKAENNEQCRLLRSAYDENSRLNDVISNMQATVNEVERLRTDSRLTEALSNMQAAFNEVEKLKTERSEQNQVLLSAYEENSRLKQELLNSSGRIRVMARISPPFIQQLPEFNYRIIDNATLEVEGLTGLAETFNFDHVFGQSASQIDVFQQLSPLIEASMMGYNTCALAYG